MTTSQPLEDDSTARSHPFRASVERFVRGRVHTRVGVLSAALGRGDFVHVRRDVEHEFSSLTEQATVPRFDCRFLPFGGVDLGPGRGAYTG